MKTMNHKSAVETIAWLLRETSGHSFAISKIILPLVIQFLVIVGSFLASYFNN